MHGDGGLEFGENLCRSLVDGIREVRKIYHVPFRATAQALKGSGDQSGLLQEQLFWLFRAIRS